MPAINGQEPALAFDSRTGLRDLAQLACSAAMELDSVLAGHASDLSAVNQLAIYLDAITQNASHTQRSPLDAMRLTLVRRAISFHAPRQQVSSSIDDVLRMATSQVSVLQGARTLVGQEPRPDLEASRDFCLALSRVAHAESIPSTDPGTEFRSRR